METAIFTPYDMGNSEIELHVHAGERCEIIGPFPLDHDEFIMFSIRFEDGQEAVAFEEELSDWSNA